MENDDLICYCFHVSRRKIVNYVKRERPPRASMISQCFGAGSGCGWCIPYLIQLHREIMGTDVEESTDISPEEYEKQRMEYLRQLGEGSRPKNELDG